MFWVNVFWFAVGVFVGTFLTALVSVNRLEDDEK